MAMRTGAGGGVVQRWGAGLEGASGALWGLELCHRPSGKPSLGPGQESL